MSPIRASRILSGSASHWLRYLTISCLASARSDTACAGAWPATRMNINVSAHTTRIGFSGFKGSLASSPLPQQYAMTEAPACGGPTMRADAKTGTQPAAEAPPDSVAVATTRTVELAKVATRREHDLLGERDVPADAYWGIHTLRAVENFPITGVPVGHFPELIRSLAFVKQAAARANRRLGHLSAEKAEAIEQACIL